MELKIHRYEMVCALEMRVCMLKMLLLYLQLCMCISVRIGVAHLHHGVFEMHTYTRARADREAEVSNPRGDNMPRWVSVRSRAGACSGGVYRDLPLCSTADSSSSTSLAKHRKWVNPKPHMHTRTHKHGYKHAHLRYLQPWCQRVGVFARK